MKILFEESDDIDYIEELGIENHFIIISVAELSK
jgi:hypothetical protein